MNIEWLNSLKYRSIKPGEKLIPGDEICNPWRPVIFILGTYVLPKDEGKFRRRIYGTSKKIN